MTPKKPSLADKLNALGVKVGVVEMPRARPKRGLSIQDVLPGRFEPAARGETFVYEQAFNAEYRHGLAPLHTSASFGLLAEWARDPRLAGMPLEAFAFLDTETSGMAGGTGTYAFLVGVGRFERSGEDLTFRLLQFFMRDPGEEGALLEALSRFLAPCHALVTYNGKAFDAPLLKTRYILQGIPVPFEGYSHVDLLHLARRLWRERLASRTLKYIEEHVLGAPRTSEEVPGYEIPWLYFDYLRSGDASPLKGVFYHNAMDIVALAALLSHTAEMLQDPFGERVQHGLDAIALARLHEDLQHWETAARLYEHGLEQTLPADDFWQAVRRLSVLQKRRGDLEQAVHWWEQAALQGHIYAHIELAKYYEHRRRDVPQALDCARSALEHLDKTGLPEFARAHWQAELEHRLARLERKAKAGPGKPKKNV